MFGWTMTYKKVKFFFEGTTLLLYLHTLKQGHGIKTPEFKNSKNGSLKY